MTYILDQILVNFLVKPGHPSAHASFILYFQRSRRHCSLSYWSGSKTSYPGGLHGHLHHPDDCLQQPCVCLLSFQNKLRWKRMLIFNINYWYKQRRWWWYSRSQPITNRSKPPRFWYIFKINAWFYKFINIYFESYCGIYNKSFKRHILYLYYFDCQEQSHL